MGSPRTWTGTNAIAALRNTIGDPSGASVTRWTDAELWLYLDRGQMQVTLDTNGTAVETVWEVTLADGQREYKLADNIYRILDVHFVFSAADRTDLRRLQYLTWGEYQDFGFGRDETTEGEPAYYYLWRKLGDDPTTAQPESIYFHPTPGAAEDTKKVEIHGYKYPDDIAADTTKAMELPAPYVEAAITYAAALVKMDDDEMGAAQAFEARYERQVQKILDSLSKKTATTPTMLRPRTSLIAPWWNRRLPLMPWERRVR